MVRGDASFRESLVIADEIHHLMFLFTLSYPNAYQEKSHQWLCSRQQGDSLDLLHVALGPREGHTLRVIILLQETHWVTAQADAVSC